MVARRIEEALTGALALAEAGAPPRIAAALWHAVFPGGGRLRPRLTLAVAQACGEDQPEVTEGAAVSIELMHCASLVHDDLPCFDDADMRRGRPSVHRQFGQPLAVLSGDALIVLAFETLARATLHQPHRLAPLICILSRSVGLPGGIVAGQAWECEPVVDLSEYHRAKTGTLFAAATAAGAAAAGVDPEPWRMLGERLGEAYQVADDIRDVAGNPSEIGKPTGRDAALGRKSAVGELGLPGALARFERLVGEAVTSIPPCRGSAQLQALIVGESRRFVPMDVMRLAA
ncbi:polyprenyl synthetase family protein [uncultured Enterovirga sp.]|uniref:polyprenyl synthetase family protein n=1 Tax=uncultured Enterovirga sp. TaxID=2026352 RepID=UPI0035CBB3BB